MSIVFVCVTIDIFSKAFFFSLFLYTFPYVERLSIVLRILCHNFRFQMP